MAITYTLADLLKVLKIDDWKATVIETAEDLGIDTENWAEGGITRSTMALFTQFYKTASDYVNTLAASGFLDTVLKDWLPLLAKNQFGVTVNAATYASAVEGITLTNHGGGLNTFEIGDLTFSHSVTKKTYKNTSVGTLNPGVGQTLKLDIEAEAPGSASTADVGAITEIVSGPLGVTCSNEVALVGLDEETPAQAKDRCRNAIAALSLGGIKRAYEFFAKSAKRGDGTPIGVTRVHVMPATGTGSTDVYIAGPGGAISGPDVAIVQDVFDTTVTPYGFDATALTATNLSIPGACTIWIPSSLGLTTADAQQAVLDALLAYVNTLPIGGVVISPATGKVLWRSLMTEIGAAIPGTLKVQLAFENDIAVADSEAPVYGGSLTDTTVVQVST